MTSLSAAWRAHTELGWCIVAWLVLSAISMPLIVFFLGPILPPGSETVQGHSQTQDNIVLTTTVAPIISLLLVGFGYSLVTFRHRGGALQDGTPMRGDTGVMIWWVALSFLTVIFLAAWGSYELFPGERGAGGGQGPSPLAIATPSGQDRALQVQVIGQQWVWTFRYPSYGGVETTKLMIPDHQLVELHVTSLDVIHSFWIPQLGIKADAVPGTDNVAFVQGQTAGFKKFRFECAELCGLWHGHMDAHGAIMPPVAFKRWIAAERRQWQPNHKYLPPYSRVYYPAPTRRAT